MYVPKWSENRNILQKLFDSIKEFIKKVSEKFSGRKAEQTLAARDAYGVDLETLKRAKNLLQKALRDSADVVSKFEKQGAKENAERTGPIKYSVKFGFVNQVDATLDNTLKRGYSVYVGKAPNLIVKCGFDPDLPMLMNPSHLKDINHPKDPKNIHWHGLNREQIKQIPNEIKNPVMIFDSISVDKENAVCVVTKLKDADGFPIIISLRANSEQNNKYYDVNLETLKTDKSNFVTSIYGKDNFRTHIEEVLNQDALLYANKEKTLKLFSDSGLQLPTRLNNLGFDKIIHQSRNIVNTYSMQKSENNSKRKNSVKMGEDITNTQKDKNIPYDYTKSFAKQIEDYKKNKFPINDTFLVCATTEILKKIGLNALPITMNQEHLDYILNNTKDEDHYLGEDFLKKLPKLLEDLLAVIEDFGHDNRLTVLVQYTHPSNGKQSIVPIEVDGYGRQNDVVIDSNAIVTTFAKGGILDTLKDILSNGGKGLYYWNKKEALTLLQMAGRQLPSDLPQDGFVNSIRKKDSKVKPKFKNVTETQQFIRFFGDWIKNPKRASKVVNEDGTPKVVYHQTAEEFDVFSTRFEKAGKYDSETPVGHFFKSTPEDIGLEGKRQMAVYLNKANWGRTFFGTVLLTDK